MLNPNCCSYTVRAYDTNGMTLWTADYFRGATAGEWSDTMDLAVCRIGGHVFVAGPRIVHGATAWNLCDFSATSGNLLGRYDLQPNGTAADIWDICRGEDGTLGALLYDKSWGTYDTSLALIASGVSNPSPYTAYQRITVDSTGTPFFSGAYSGNMAAALDGTEKYIVGGLVNDVGGLSPDVWFLAYGYAKRGPGANAFPIASPDISTLDWLSVAARTVPNTSPDTPRRLTDVAILKDSGGTSTDLITISPGHYRGNTASAAVGGSYTFVESTSGTLAESGQVGRFDTTTGNHKRAFDPAAGITLARAATVQGAGYYVGGSRAANGSLFAIDSSDTKRWTHNHQSLTGLASTAAGGIVTVGLRSRRSDDQSFI